MRGVFFILVLVKEMRIVIIARKIFNHKIHKEESCKEMVKYVKNTGLNNRLRNTLVSFVDTRWNTVFKMLDSIKTSYADGRCILHERSETNSIDIIDQSEVEVVAEFLKPFVEMTKVNESSKRPTLCYVQPYIEFMKKHLETKDTDHVFFC